MVVLDNSKEDIIVQPENEEVSREERRRTGRYLASGIAIFLLVLGFYHAVLYGATKYAALLGAALIMFLYLLWLLYASHRKKKFVKLFDCLGHNFYAGTYSNSIGFISASMVKTQMYFSASTGPALGEISSFIVPK